MNNTAKNLNISDGNLTLLSGYKFTQSQQKIILEILQDNPNISSPKLIQKMKDMNTPLSISERHLNRVRVLWGLNRNQGRPKGKKELEESKKK